MLAQFRKNKVRVGVIADDGYWFKVFGEQCTGVGDYPLYWYPNEDNDPSFDSFKPFAEWKKPEVKLFKQQ